MIGKLDDIEMMLTEAAGTVVEAAEVPTEFYPAPA